MTDKQKIDEFFWNKTTPEVARDLLGMYLEHDTPEGRLAGYIVDAEAYLGPEDEAAHSYGLRRTPRVRAMYEKPGTIYDVALDWDTKNHTIEIVVRLFAENKAQFEIDDAEGIVSQEPIIEFEDGVLLFNPQKSVFDERNYLAVIPYEGKKGLAKSVADSLVEYLNEVLAQGQSDLLDFLDEDDDEAVFELHWDNQQLAELVEVKQQNEADTYLPYPSY